MHHLTADATELSSMRRRLADQAMALELLAALPAAASVDAAIDELLVLTGNLCGAHSVGFIDQAGVAWVQQFDGDDCTRVVNDVTDRAQLLAASPMSWWRRSGDFAVEVGVGAEQQGSLVVLEVGLPDHIDEYLNLLLSMAPAIAVGLRDVAARTQISATGEAMPPGDTVVDADRVVDALSHSPIPSGLLTLAIPGRPRLVSPNEALCRFLRIDAESESDLGAAAGHLCEGLPLGSAHHQVEKSFRIANGRERSGLVCISRLGDDPGWEQLRLVQLIDTSEHHRINDALQHQSEHDPVSDLPNRALLLHTVNAALSSNRPRRGSGLALILLDLDDFKSVNRGLGHDVGNNYLRCVADALVEWARPQDFVAHLGSDEFAVVLPGVRDSSTAVALADSLRARLAAGVDVAGATVSAAASLGVAISTSRATATSMLAKAEQAMFTAKNHGGNQWQLATTESAPDATNRVVRIESDMRRAIANDEFELRYQPVIDIAETGQIVAVEALLRWEHPTLGRMMPGEFIPVAERRSLMSELGAWVLASACRQAAEWEQTFGDNAPRIAINVSTRQLGTGSFLGHLHSNLRTHHLSLDRISLEVTESQLLRASGPAADELRAIAETGIEIAIDDFGTGYAGFDYLRHLPIHILKIDKSFIDHVVTDDTDRAILAGITALGTTLGLTMVAEGVETPEQLAAVRELGCQQAQGWLWRPALRPDDVTALLGVHERDLRVR